MIHPMERLNKLLAQAGIASRRGADDLVHAGRVTINGLVVVEPGTQVDPTTDDVRLDGERVIVRPTRHRYLLLHKPRDVLTTVSDPEGRPTVMDLVPRDLRLFPVGRLDGGSEGLVLMTNDGDLAHHLSHPSFQHAKEYRVKISGTPTEEALRVWREGMWIDDERTAPAEVRIESTTGAGTWLRVVLREGKNRQIRRMTEAFHHRVHRLIRIRLGPITLGDLKPGTWRELTPAEVAALRGDPGAAAELERARGRRADGPRYKPGWARPKPPKTKPGRKKPRTTAPRRPPGPGAARKPGRRPAGPRTGRK